MISGDRLWPDNDSVDDLKEVNCRKKQRHQHQQLQLQQPPEQAENFHMTRFSPCVTEESNKNRYSFGRFCAPRFCQVFNSAPWVLVFWCIASFAQSGFMNGSANAVLTTLEKRYQLTSTDVGFIVSVNDMVTIAVVALVSYYGGRGRKPQWIAFGCLLLGLGSLLFTLPQAVFGTYKYSTPVEPLCLVKNVGDDVVGGNTTSVPCETSPVGQHSLLIFLVAQVMAGVGSTPLYTIGITYLDESAGPKRSALYLGIFMTMWVVGPAAGFMLAAASLKVYVDFPAQPTIAADSALWVGAWWLPFLFFGFVLIFFTFIPIVGYPNELPETRVRNSKVAKEETGALAVAGATTKEKSKTKATASVHAGFSGDRATLFKAMHTVATNQTFWLLSLGTACHSFTSSIFATFGAKLLQDMFNVEPANAAFLFGVFIVPGAGIGTFVGGYILKRYNLSIRQILSWMIVVGIGTLPPFLGFLLSCSGAPFAGLYDSYPLQSNLSIGAVETSALTQIEGMQWVEPQSLAGLPNLTAMCNANCTCSPNAYMPICGSDGVQYYSPCYAGCQTFVNTEQKLYVNCSCIQPPSSMHTAIQSKSQYQIALESLSFASIGSCERSTLSLNDSQCFQLPIFLVLIFIIALLQFSVGVPIIQVLIRCVPENCASVSLGINSLIFRLLGVIPGPIIGGAVFDRFCVFWQRIGCFKDESCLAYDMYSVRITLMCVCLAMHVLQVFFYLLARHYFKEPTNDELAVPLELEVAVTSEDTSAQTFEPSAAIRPRRPL